MGLQCITVYFHCTGPIGIPSLYLDKPQADVSYPTNSPRLLQSDTPISPGHIVCQAWPQGIKFWPLGSTDNMYIYPEAGGW